MDEESISDSDPEGGGYANGDALDQAQSKTSKHTVDDLIDTEDDIDEQSNSTSDEDDTDEQSNSSSGEDDPQTASNKKQVPYLEKVKYLEQYIDKRCNKDAEFSKTELKDLSGKLAKVGDKKEDVKPGKVQSLLEVARQRWRKKTTQTKADMFSSPEGVKPVYFDAQKETPGTVFLKFLDDIITDILYQTNHYMTQKHRRISPILKREFYGFIGMNIIMSYHILPAIRDYWIWPFPTSHW
ncbi:hypothetical protein SNE40_020544 [Patella caerulea]|uniref:PiggyBac transposable element-derived protein domain-containing protein n=1 Tax=Patella caerulea TaxID=87958 RepID=A0AAN8G7Q7_PATCE